MIDGATFSGPFSKPDLGKRPSRRLEKSDRETALAISFPDRAQAAQLDQAFHLARVSKRAGSHHDRIRKREPAQANGKIDSEVVVLAGEGGLLLGVRAGDGPALRDRLDRHLIMENAEIASVGEPALQWLLAIGEDAEVARVAEIARARGDRAALMTRAGQRACFIATPREVGSFGALATDEEWLKRRIELKYLMGGE